MVCSHLVYFANEIQFSLARCVCVSVNAPWFLSISLPPPAICRPQQDGLDALYSELFAPVFLFSFFVVLTAIVHTCHHTQPI